MKKGTNSFTMYLLIFAFITSFIYFTTINKTTDAVKNYYYSDLIKDFKEEKIYKIDILSNSDVIGKGKARIFFDANNEKDYKIVEIPDMTSFMADINSSSNDIIIETKPFASTKWISDILIPIGFILVSVFFIVFLIRQNQGKGGSGRDMNFGKSKARKISSEENKVNFENVAGLDEEKIEMKEIVDFLKSPQKYVEVGARIPKGILLVGPPGTGKTLLAKAVAGESKVSFFSISGSDFVEMYVGVGASRVRDMFAQAKKHAPCLIFIDEIDAVGRRRGSGHGGGHDEREQTLNQLLVEMDGFAENEGIIMMAATNRRDILDPALLRPGRFDREVVVNKPDVKGREEILKIHAAGKVFDDAIDLKTIAKSTSGFTGADLENLLNESALLTARDDKKQITMEYVRKAIIKVGVGTEKTSRVVSERDREITAYHEAGHAIIQEMLNELDPVHIVSIIPTGSAGGFTMFMPEDDKSYVSKTKMTQEIISLLAGRAAEEIIFDEITTGASSDINRASRLGRSMIKSYGMNPKLGIIEFSENEVDHNTGTVTKSYSEETAKLIDNELKILTDDCYLEAKRILNEQSEVMHNCAKILLEKDKITGKEFRALFPDGVLPNKNISVSLMNPEQDSL